MGLRDDFLRKITKQQTLVAEIEVTLRIERATLATMQDMYKLLPKDGAASTDSSALAVLRKGSGTSRAYEALKQRGIPMHVNDIANAIGKKPTREVTQGLASSMRAYVMKGEIFTKPAPNTYGLVEWGTAAPDIASDGQRLITLEED